MEKDKKTINRCSECGLYKTPQTDICPECGGIMDLAIKGEDLSWSCRQYTIKEFKFANVNRAIRFYI